MFPSTDGTKKRIRSENTVANPAEGEGEGDIENDGESDAEALKDADGDFEALGLREALGDVKTDEGLADAEGEIDGLAEELTDADGLLDALGDREADVTLSPISIRACPADKESLNFRMSRFEPNLNDPGIPLSSKEEIPPLKLVISYTFCLLAIV